MNDNIFQISRSILAVVFVVSSIGKTRDLSMFTSVVQVHLGLRSRKMSRALAALTVISELIVAILLILPEHTSVRFGLFGASGLLLAFTAVMGRNALRESPLDCFCFGRNDQQVNRWLPLTRLAMLGVPLILSLMWWSSQLSAWPTVLEFAAGLLLCALGTWVLTLPSIVIRHQQDSTLAAGAGVIDLSRAPLSPLTLLQRIEE